MNFTTDYPVSLFVERYYQYLVCINDIKRQTFHYYIQITADRERRRCAGVKEVYKPD